MSDEENVKKVLFGNQKQADVINDAVAEDVTAWLKELYGEGCCYSEDGVVKTISQALQDACDPGEIANETLVKYVAGKKSLENLKNALGPCVVNVSQPNMDSPKRKFRIHVLGEVPKEDTTSTSNVYNKSEDFDTVTYKDETETPKERVHRFIQEYSPKCTASELTKSEERALYAMYFEYGGTKSGRDKGIGVESQLGWIIIELKDLCPTAIAKELRSDVKMCIYALSFML